MLVILDKREKATTRTVNKGDTLAQIAAQSGPDITWQAIALFNWGTILPREVLRALCETIGADVKEVLKDSNRQNPETMPLNPANDLRKTILIPAVFKQSNLAIKKTHTVKVKRIIPANAVAINRLDKWFLPETETCDIRYGLQGLSQTADKLDLDIYGSNYCDCTGWPNGLGTYANPSAMLKKPLFRKTDLDAAQRLATGTYDWTGECTITDGPLSKKRQGQAKRYINVAFSPYTVHMRYYKTDPGNDKPQLVLLPFWPQWEDQESTPAITTQNYVQSPAKIGWTNAADQDTGVMEITDASGQLVWIRKLTTEELKSGNKVIDWDKSYTGGALNGRFEPRYLNDAAAPWTTVVAPGGTQAADGLLFTSAPYVPRVTTAKYRKKNPSFYIEWKFLHTGDKLKRGLIRIVDGKDRLVYQRGMAASMLTQNDPANANSRHRFLWDGKYGEGVKYDDHEEAHPSQMPYRVEIQAHTEENVADGLALAARHSEVRLYCHQDLLNPTARAYDPLTSKPALALSSARHYPKDPPPASGETPLYYQYKLAECGYHPGPVNGQAGNALDGEPVYRIALRDFKRSVPRDGSVAAGQFRRMAIAGGALEAENVETTTALNTLRPIDQRGPYGTYDLISANSETPTITTDQFDQRLRNPGQDTVVWIDQRQYYTRTSGSWDPNDQGMFANAGSEVGRAGLLDYRGDMDVGDNQVTLDADAVPRPWLPLKAQPTVLRKADSLYPAHADNRVYIADDDERAAMRRAIGPLRVDWTFDELPYDVSVIDTGLYHRRMMRTRKYAGWTLRQQSETHRRPQATRDIRYTNCPATLGGVRPHGAPDTYYEKLFARGDISLTPWRATADATPQTIATVIHDHIADPNPDSTRLFEQLYEPLIGTAGVYFVPSRVAGDGYRVRANISFDKFTNYDFPNLPVLKNRYPVTPNAVTCGLRTWRRSSIRGSICWQDPGESVANPGYFNHFPAYVARYRQQWRTAHVYFVHQSGAPETFTVRDLVGRFGGEFGNMSADNTFKALVRRTLEHEGASLAAGPLDPIPRTPRKPSFTTEANITLHDGYSWAFSAQPNYGYPYPSTVNLAQAKLFKKFLNEQIANNIWDIYNVSLLYALVVGAEALGHMRGHLFVEFLSSPRLSCVQYRCNGATTHNYWYLDTIGATTQAGARCPSPGCMTAPVPPAPPNPGIPAQNSVLAATGTVENDRIAMDAIGLALGATWLYTDSGDADTWVHEVGHHRHMEHAASAGGAVPAQHDTARHRRAAIHNAWGGDWADVDNQNWDAGCVMSYNEDIVRNQYNTGLCFCGKCVLRGRGWRVQGLPNPAQNNVEPDFF